MAETPSPLSDPRYRAGVRLRRGGRFEAAANLLAEVLTLATEGAPDERQLDPALAPLYYEYGVALVGVAREAAAAEEDAEAAPSPKRRRLAGEAGGEEALRCSICLDPLRDATLLRMPCARNHIFHKICLLAWLETKNSCPVCRHRLPTEADEAEEREAEARAKEERGWERRKAAREARKAGK